MAAAYGLPIAAVLSAAIGVSLLRYAWRRPDRWHAAIVAGGWAALIVAVVVYSAAFGVEVGSAHAAVAFCIAGFAAVLINIELRVPKQKAARARSIAPAETAPSIGRAILRTITAGGLAALAAYQAGIAYVACAPGPSPDLLVFGASIMLVAWSALIVWAMSAVRVGRVALVLFGGAMLANVLARWPGLCE